MVWTFEEIMRIMTGRLRILDARLNTHGSVITRVVTHSVPSKKQAGGSTLMPEEPIEPIAGLQASGVLLPHM
jgi:hypothetical protein